jgi:hypothetical protein
VAEPPCPTFGLRDSRPRTSCSGPVQSKLRPAPKPRPKQIAEVIEDLSYRKKRSGLSQGEERVLARAIELFGDSNTDTYRRFFALKGWPQNERTALSKAIMCGSDRQEAFTGRSYQVDTQPRLGGY